MTILLAGVQRDDVDAVIKSTRMGLAPAQKK